MWLGYGSDHAQVWPGCGSDVARTCCRMWLRCGSDVFSDVVESLAEVKGKRLRAVAKRGWNYNKPVF